MSSISLLWSETDPRTSFADFSFVDDLHLTELINPGLRKKAGEMDQPLSGFFSTDRDTLSMRCDLFLELLDDPEFYRGLRECFEQLTDFYRLGIEKEVAATAEDSLYSVKELEMYVAFFEKIRVLFSAHPAKSAFLSELQKKANEICEDGDYIRLRDEVKKQNHTVNRVRSVTVGINLDARLMPSEAGVVKVNEQSFVSGSFIDKLLRLDFADSEFTCSTPLLPITKGTSPSEEAALRAAMNAALNKLFAGPLKSWSSVIRKYVLKGVDWLFPLLPEMNFLIVCTDALFQLKNRGKPLCKPEFGENDRVSGLYHPMLALTDGKVIVQNNLTFDNDGRIYILTGPNQGGKSIYTSAVGILYAMLHLGLPLPAESVEICPVDAILTHFADKQATSYQKGRFATECTLIQKVSSLVSQDSLILFDEALSSTGSREASILAEEILDAYAEIGAKGIWATHLHELCSLPDRMTGGKSRLCNLTAQIDQTTHSRKYIIKKGDPFGKSYAMDIARQYRLTKDDILASHNSK